MSWITIIFYILLLDAVTAVAMSFAGKQNWWQAHLGSGRNTSHLLAVGACIISSLYLSSAGSGTKW
ncbi:MAG: hypothetical protein R3B69_02375 [Candidatus Paceibacterota bacterium]